VVVFGHSHQPVIAEDAGLLLVNPGSAIDRRRAPTCSMAVLEIAEGRVEATLVPLLERGT
jgi:predicted phosphodiesterase